jgi:hypothetical protein
MTDGFSLLRSARIRAAVENRLNRNLGFVDPAAGRLIKQKAQEAAPMPYGDADFWLRLQN